MTWGTTGRHSLKPNFRAEAKKGKSQEQQRREFRSKDNSSIYPENWAEISATIRKRDGYRCQCYKVLGGKSCGAYFPPPFQFLLQAHHVIPLDVKGTRKSNSHLNNPKNLICVAVACHSQIHGRKVGFEGTKKQIAAAKR